MTAPTVQVDRLALSGSRGTVFAPVSFALGAGQLGVVCGRSGSGRSSLLLAVGGRMRGLTGTGRVAGQDLVTRARAVRSATAVARIASLVDVEPQLTVAESITERSLTEGVSAAAAERAVARAEELLDGAFPRSALVGELSRLDRGRFALALARVRPAQVILFDDVDRDLDPAQQRLLFAALNAVADAGPAVLASTVNPETVPASAHTVHLPPSEN